MTTFVLEDETGLSTATSYIDVTFADDYLGKSWATGKSTTDKQNAIIEGSEYVDARFFNKLRGRPLVNDQGLEFPRSGLYNVYGVLVEGLPNDLKKAVAIYAEQSLNGTLYPTNETTAKEIKKKKTVVGPIATEIEYVGSNRAKEFLNFPLADRLMAQFLKTYGGRAVRN
jgi:hypothetical protein